MNRLGEIYFEAKADPWLKGFALFCRIAMAVSFLPAGMVKIMGERFAEGLPSNNPLGHYFDALYLTGYYYTFIGITQVIIALLLLIPRTALLGALMYFPVIINIGVLTYALRFDGTRLVTMLALACLYVLCWDYDRIRPVLPFKQPPKSFVPVIKNPLGKRLRIVFFGSCIALLTMIIGGTFYLYDITPGNSEEACRNGCITHPAACGFCDCIYKEGKPLDSCLAAYHKEKKMHSTAAKQ